MLFFQLFSKLKFLTHAPYICEFFVFARMLIIQHREFLISMFSSFKELILTSEFSRSPSSSLWNLLFGIFQFSIKRCFCSGPKLKSVFWKYLILAAKRWSCGLGNFTPPLSVSRSRKIQLTLLRLTRNWVPLQKSSSFCVDIEPCQREWKLLGTDHTQHFVFQV